MYRFSRFLSGLLGLTLGMQLIPAFAAPFTDVKTSTQYGTAINALQEKGILEGYADGSFKSSAHINRAEFLKIVAESLNASISDAETPCFPDGRNTWYEKYLCWAVRANIVSGYPDGMFHGERDINFVEAAKILSLAYKQPSNGTGSEWYEPYARALESSKAIPPSIEKLDAPLTRGEMAEMMWRLSEGRTDQPTQGYINVKYPEVAINMASDAPQTAKSCADLRAITSEASENHVMYFRGDTGGAMIENAGGPVPAAAPSANKAVSDGDYSQTNVQVEGVDEADIVKSDGEYLYIVRNAEKSTVRIVKATPANAMKEVAVLTLNDAETGIYAQDLYIDGDTLIVIGQRQHFYPMPMVREGTSAKMIAPGEYYPGSSVPRTDVRLYNVSDAASPRLVRTLSFDGNQISTRKIGAKLYLVLNEQPWWGGPIPLGATEKDLLPQMEDSKTGVSSAVTRCASVVVLPRIPRPQYLTVAAIPTDNVNGEVKSAVVLGSAENVYSSLKNLYVASTDYQYRWDTGGAGPIEKTHLYRFEFTTDGISMKSQGTVPGRILNQFSMDERENTFRIATTMSEQWQPDGTSLPSRNNLYVLNLSLEPAGKIEDIAPGEQIYSVRFLGDRAYMVTFKKIDPFFVIDLSDARNPKILGKLKIPGYSDYLHPYDENHVIGFGKEAVEAKTGDPSSPLGTGFAWYQGMKIAIFDVTDVANPKELHKTVIGDRGTDSPLLHNHKALLFDKARNLLAFPIQVSKITEEQKRQSPDGSAYGSPVFQGAYVYDLTLSGGFKLRGTITHVDDSSRYEKAGDYWYGGGTDVERIVRIGSSLYTISQSSVRAHGEVDIKEQGRVELR